VQWGQAIVTDYIVTTKEVFIAAAAPFTIAAGTNVAVFPPALTATTPGTRLDVTATGAAGINWANVENPTTAVDLSGTDIQLADTVTTLTGHTAQTADHTAAIAAVKVDTAATLADTGTDGVVLAGTPNVNVAQINTDATAAARLALSAAQIIPGTVDTVTNTHTPTTTEFQADDITEATTDHFKGRVVIFTSNALISQATDITGYTAVGGIGQFTVTAMTEAPANNDTFIII
jgi:hypothetical protein